MDIGSSYLDHPIFIPSGTLSRLHRIFFLSVVVCERVQENNLNESIVYGFVQCSQHINYIALVKNQDTKYPTQYQTSGENNTVASANPSQMALSPLSPFAFDALLVAQPHLIPIPVCLNRATWA